MKLIIDIPDHIYSMVTNTGTFGCYRYNTSKAIRQGIPLDDIKTEIPKLSHWQTDDGQDLLMVADALEYIDRHTGE